MDQSPSLPLKGYCDYSNALTLASLFPLFAENTGRPDPSMPSCHQNHLQAEAV